MIADDIRFDILGNPNKGGQQVPSSNYGLTATHIPTGLQATCKTERSQYENRLVAIAMIEAGLNKMRKG